MCIKIRVTNNKVIKLNDKKLITKNTKRKCNQKRRICVRILPILSVKTCINHKHEMSLWLGLLNWDISNDEDEEAINVFYIEE